MKKKPVDICERMSTNLRFLLLAVFLMAPGMTLAGGTITRFDITSNFHPMDAPGANLEVWFGVDGYDGWNNYQVQSISILVENTETACLDVEPDITTPGQYIATGFTDNDGSGFVDGNTLKAYKAYPDDDCDNHDFDDGDQLFTFDNWGDYSDDYLECFIFEVQEPESSGAGGKSRLQDEHPREECRDLTTFSVLKWFTDGNPATEITLDFWCNNGSFNPKTVDVVAQDGVFEQTFVVENLKIDDDTICTVTERPVDGYDTSYLCGLSSQSTRGEDCVTWFDDYQNDATDCNWSNVWPGQENFCLIKNSPTPVDVSVTKVWDVTNMGGDYFDTTASLRIFCDNENGIIRPNDNNEIIEPEDYTDGEYTLTVQVVPDWYPTAIPPAKQEYTECWATEDEVYDSAVEVTSTCGDDEHPAMMIAVGMGDSCVITNTVFFEGIPTLNQYGMAIMALLMLGMGFVGFRRFV